MKYRAIKNKYLAFALAYCGFRFQKHEENNLKVYTFENNEQLKEIIEYLTTIRNTNKIV